MFQITLPNNILYCTPEQLPRLLANLAETNYQAASGELLQTVTSHRLAGDLTTAVLLIKSPIDTARDEREQYKDLWEQARARAEKAEAKLEKAKKRRK